MPLVQLLCRPRAPLPRPALPPLPTDRERILGRHPRRDSSRGGSVDRRTRQFGATLGRRGSGVRATTRPTDSRVEPGRLRRALQLRAWPSRSRRQTVR